MARLHWFQSLTIVKQAMSEWEAAAVWANGIAQSERTNALSGWRRPAAWLVAAAWRCAIILALVAALLIEFLTVLLRPLALVIDSLLGWLLLPVTGPLEIAMSIPYLGRLLSWLWRGLLTLFWGLLHALEAPLVLLAIMPTRRLRLWVLPTGASAGFQTESWLQSIRVASSILQREANVQLVPVIPWESVPKPNEVDALAGQYSWIRELPFERVRLELPVACNLEALKEDMGFLGGLLERLCLVGHPRGSYRRISGWGSPIMAVSVTSVAAGQLAGCSLGPLADYITVRKDQPICLAHEIAHACNLGHHDAADNLMNPTCGGVHLTRWQVLLLRLSRHTTYL